MLGTLFHFRRFSAGSGYLAGNRLMKRCHHCGGKFGLVRHRHYTLQFCTARCLEIWTRVQSNKVRQERFLEWLLPGTPSLTARPASIPARNGAWGEVNQTSSRMRSPVRPRTGFARRVVRVGGCADLAPEPTAPSGVKDQRCHRHQENHRHKDNAPLDQSSPPMNGSVAHERRGHRVGISEPDQRCHGESQGLIISPFQTATN
jgi:hypothetical protein